MLTVSRYVVDVLGKVGLALDSGETGGGVDDQSDQRGVSAGAVMETLLTFRSKVRGASLGGQKALKAARKGLKQGSSSSTGAPSEAATAVAAAGGALGEVLEACDWVRDTACPAIGVQVEDVSGSLSTWKKSD